MIMCVYVNVYMYMYTHILITQFAPGICPEHSPTHFPFTSGQGVLAHLPHRTLKAEGVLSELDPRILSVVDTNNVGLTMPCLPPMTVNGLYQLSVESMVILGIICYCYT